ncbi:hypothetical protein ISCGN_011515 [Ixodes scapularis]
MDSDASEDTSGQASVSAALVPRIPAVSTGEVSELMHAMDAIFVTFSKEMGLALVVLNPAPTPVPSSRLSVPTTAYSGCSVGTSVHDFPQNLDMYIAALGASDGTAFIQILPIALEGDAACWRQRAFLSMTDFRARLRKVFLPRHYQMRIKDKLASRTQHPDESLVEYIRALQDLYSRAKPTASEAENVARNTGVAKLLWPAPWIHSILKRVAEQQTRALLGRVPVKEVAQPTTAESRIITRIAGTTMTLGAALQRVVVTVDA